MLNIAKMLFLCLLLSSSFRLSPAAAQEVHLINATSVPAIELAIDHQLYYPLFPSGQYTAGSATHSQQVHYQLRDPRSERTQELTLNFAANSRQAVVFYGDFSLIDAATNPGTTYQVHSLVLDYTLAPDQAPLRYRLINLLPGRELSLPGKPTVTIPYGKSHSLYGQAASTVLTVHIDGEPFPLWIRQQRILRNCDIIFYPLNGQMAIIRFFEPSLEPAAEKIPPDFAWFRGLILVGEQ